MKKVVLVRLETSPEDIVGMQVSQGILTVRGGMTSHAAVVARGMGTCCVSGCGNDNDVKIDEEAKSHLPVCRGLGIPLLAVRRLHAWQHSSACVFDFFNLALNRCSGHSCGGFSVLTAFNHLAGTEVWLCSDCPRPFQRSSSPSVPTSTRHSADTVHILHKQFLHLIFQIFSGNLSISESFVLRMHGSCMAFRQRGQRVVRVDSSVLWVKVRLIIITSVSSE